VRCSGPSWIVLNNFLTKSNFVLFRQISRSIGIFLSNRDSEFKCLFPSPFILVYHGGCSLEDYPFCCVVPWWKSSRYCQLRLNNLPLDQERWSIWMCEHPRRSW
jgi:hypothetical protein